MAYSGFSMATDGSVTRMVNDATPACTLEDYLRKYNSDDVSPNNFLNTMRSVKYINKHWTKLPEQTRRELLEILTKANTPLGNDIKGPIGSTMLNFIDNFESGPSSRSHSSVMSITDPHMSSDTAFMWLCILIVLVVVGIIMYYKSTEEN